MAQLLSSLPVGAKVKFGKYSVNGETAQHITWLIVDKSTPSAITLLTERVIDVRQFDAPEVNHPNADRKKWGYNRYSASNIDQWLNDYRAGGAWYVARHTYDAPPADGEIPYANRPGFLNAFSTLERDSILDTTVEVAIPIPEGGLTEPLVRKVFLPSTLQVNNGADVSGFVWNYFSNNSSVAYLTDQAYNYTTWSSKPASVNDPMPYWTRSPRTESLVSVVAIGNQINLQPIAAEVGIGIRPALNVVSNLPVSDKTDSEGCYVVAFNEAPNAPSIITTPYAIYGGKSNAISWSVVNDPNGDIVTYQLECSINGGEYTQIYSGTSVAYAHLVPFGTSTVSYRVKATDPSGESSAYTTSATIDVVNNNAPVISGSDTNLGVKSEGFTDTYTIEDADKNTVTVTEAIDGVRIRTLIATNDENATYEGVKVVKLGEEITYGVTETTWLALPNGSHTLTISATDGIDTSVRTITFTKLVDKFSIQNSTPWVSYTMPTRIMLVITRNIPSAATFKVEVCNNGYDASPVWEDATDAVKSGLVHVFANEEKEQPEVDWGVLVRVTVERNGATGACYISAIGGNFE